MEDRDVKSAITILYEAIKQVGEHNLNLQESFVTGLLSQGSNLNNLVDSRSQTLKCLVVHIYNINPTCLIRR